MILTIYKPDGYSRKDESTEECYLQCPVELGLDGVKEGLQLRFFLPGHKASWYGDLILTPSQAEKLADEINRLLLIYEAKARIR